MSFGSSGVDLVRSFRKIQLQVFLRQKWPEWPLGAGFAQVLSTETQSAKTHQTRVLGQTGWIGAFVSKKLATSFFAPEVARSAIGAGFA
jgi:hypothetical protein